MMVIACSGCSSMTQWEALFVVARVKSGFGKLIFKLSSGHIQTGRRSGDGCPHPYTQPGILFVPELVELIIGIFARPDTPLALTDPAALGKRPSNRMEAGSLRVNLGAVFRDQ